MNEKKIDEIYKYIKEQESFEKMVCKLIGSSVSCCTDIVSIGEKKNAELNLERSSNIGMAIAELERLYELEKRYNAILTDCLILQKPRGETCEG